MEEHSNESNISDSQVISIGLGTCDKIDRSGD